MPNKKRRSKLSLKEEKLVNALTKVDSVAEAGRLAGYNTKQAAHQALARVRERAPEALQRLGITRDRVFQKLGALMDAKETKFFADKGVVMETREVEAQDIQMRATVELAKMHGAYPRGTDENVMIDSGGIMINVGVFNEPGAAQLFEELKRRTDPSVLKAMEC
jgi:hypothetical protein